MNILEQRLEIHTDRRTLRADTLTPIACYESLRHDGPSILFESMEGSGRTSRYTVVACEPLLTFTHRNGVSYLEGSILPAPIELDGDPFDHIQTLLAEIDFPEVKPFFTGFLAGYLGFETFKYIEPSVTFPRAGKEDPPDVLLILPGTVIRFDNYHHTLELIIHEPSRNVAGPALDQKLDKLTADLVSSKPDLSAPGVTTGDGASRIRTTTVADFKPRVEAIRDYIQAGDIFQAVLSRRKTLDEPADPLEVYRELRRINPSPYMYLLELPGLNILGASPETMVKCEGNEVLMRPIAGTRRRGKDPVEERALGEELLGDEKELAEHDMLVDLGRNDVGRVSEMGSVKVQEYRKLEYFSHVMHIVSTVVGRKRTGFDAIDVFKACFPAGTVSGAPKIRAVEIINELEEQRRGPYAGAIGYFDFAGNSDTCIAIRTLVGNERSSWWQAGAGIVADSRSELEFKETENKGRIFAHILLGED